mmetsp:Transcript_28877/g.46474  ORF Transcript_28877/g.46474 Transcript_28877/m.46474 type:complete len:180 (-) Transcript_28877:88-627(-)
MKRLRLSTLFVRRVLPIFICLGFEASAVVLRKGTDSTTPAFTHTLKQYAGKFCSGKYVALELKLDSMLQLNLQAGRGPEQLCNKLTQDGDSYVVDSCAGTSDGCPASCNECQEDLVKHFKIDECKDGWKLVAGAAPEDCTDGHIECTSKNQVDIGLARWCDKWPTTNTLVKAKTADELE